VRCRERHILARMVMPRPRRWRLPLLFLLLAGLGALVLGLGGLDTTVLDLLPLVLLIAVMLIWPYPGEELIARLSRRPGRHPRPARSAPRLRPPLRTPHGGRLISLSLGGRAPPAAAGCA
jgi:hypothetical protein